LWSKFISLATNAGLTGLARQPAGVVYHTPEARAAAERLIGEAVAVGRAAGVALEPDAAEQAMAFLKALPAEMYASLYHDLERGRPLEIESLSGVISTMGRNLGIDTPCHDLVYACLKPLAEGARRAGRVEPSARKEFNDLRRSPLQ
jgi:2-dehydropantoate 2-reductase